MHSPLHKKILSMCQIQRKDPLHWILTGSKTVWAVEIQAVVTTKRAAYAAFVGPIPEGKEVASSCGCRQCIRPDHQVLQTGKAPSRALSLPGELAMLGRPEQHSSTPQELALPKGIGVEVVRKVKAMLAGGTPVITIAAALKLRPGEVVGIHNGARDSALREASVGRVRTSTRVEKKI
jgi:hypothetical protein